MQKGAPMKITNLFRIVISGLAVFAAANLWAQDGGPGRSGARGNGTEALLQQLELSDEQAEEIEGIMSESRESRKAILAKHGVEMGKGVRPDRELMKAAQPEIAALRKETDAKVLAVLSDEQKAKFQELRGKGKQGQGQGQKKSKKSKAGSEE